MKIQTKSCLTSLLCLVLLSAGDVLYAQPTFNPIPVTGFTQDIVAEAGTGAGSLDAISSTVDGSNHAIYSVSFGSEFQFGGGIAWWSGGNWVPYPQTGSPPGGLPDNGTIASGRYNFQFANYTGNNCLMISDLTGSIPTAQLSGTLTLTSPVNYVWYSVALFSTEGPTDITATFNFTDGSSATTPVQTINDWFPPWNNTMDVIVSSMGWTSASSPTPLHDNEGSNWDFNKTQFGETSIYAWNIMVPCASQGKTVQSITFTCAGGGNGGTHRVNIMGLAGYGNYSVPNFSANVLPARCGVNNGLASMTSNGGGTSPFTYSWSTTPAQTTTVITGLAPGYYTCTVSDSNNCNFPFIDTIVAVTAPALTAAASPATVCQGTNTTLTVKPATTGDPLVYTWSANSQIGSSVTVAPTSNTLYTVIGKDFYGCADTATVAVAVTPPPTAAFSVNPVPSCTNGSDTVSFTGTAGSAATYNWNSFAGATIKGGSGAGPYTIEFSQPGTYNVQLEVSENGCSASYTGPVVVQGTSGSPVVTVGNVTVNSVTFSWQPVVGATGYQVSVNGGTYSNPSSGSTGTTEVVSGLNPQQNVSISVIALGGNSCQASTAGTGKATTYDDGVFIPNSFTPNGDGRNDVFKIYSNQATGMDMKIFNQWGQLVYSTGNLGDGWDGMYKGQMQPSGVYIYAVRVKLMDGSEIVRKGSINLLR